MGEDLTEVMAVTQQDFSSDDKFLQMAVQIIDRDNNIHHDSGHENYMVWDIFAGKFV